MRLTPRRYCDCKAVIPNGCGCVGSVQFLCLRRSDFIAIRGDFQRNYLLSELGAQLRISVQSLLRPLSHHSLAWHDSDLACRCFGSNPPQWLLHPRPPPRTQVLSETCGAMRCRRLCCRAPKIRGNKRTDWFGKSHVIESEQVALCAALNSVGNGDGDVALCTQFNAFTHRVNHFKLNMPMQRSNWKRPTLCQ